MTGGLGCEHASCLLVNIRNAFDPGIVYPSEVYIYRVGKLCKVMSDLITGSSIYLVGVYHVGLLYN